MATKSSRVKATNPVTLFKVLADTNRYKAIQLLIEARKGLLVIEVATALKMGHSATSHLLGLLNDVGVVSYNKEGRTVRYGMANSPVAKTITNLLRASIK
jgi:DNA-binding transcriptional ArsR family regulator